ncbi:leucyl/phenylalanyl-tRNA--protein transferase [Methyloversatilis sp.]|uniref:leucyl/phenylalanyl-tRNA--protein transferase n=1 Tax=Methyloversatilis sp. TaxID=2569862 RepID=UPI0027365ED0|nr:leucyl/phenylalanyl-tRNA--protein transferase [Methyloversatilis sp.]MDP2868264.1 leucyl/phenylalanyl-tRNA--protein transferase [Methyloversatilis sp.]MDP3454316.1 leucyl/phenylalanyl-tRNA--protein transferase [Methyloversatilis sp.]MDP3580249.1 leucyl/phenylalanyl-tRNA--protein transferase [Methyloversatilis sp.]
MIPWLEPGAPFPPVERALREPDGLLAAGLELTPDRIIDAYRQGIFPWFSDGQPVLWWSPDPRMVLLPSEIRITRSMVKVLRNRPYEVRCDSAFETVMRACAAPRDGQGGTWISDEMVAAYTALHHSGYAHSVETWIDGRLAGGLYGMAIGRMFYGESMFSTERDASKIALVHLARYLETQGFGLIDCQMNTGHLGSMGGREIPRREFCRVMAQCIADGPPPGRWPTDLIPPYYRI